MSTNETMYAGLLKIYYDKESDQSNMRSINTHDSIDWITFRHERSYHFLSTFNEYFKECLRIHKFINGLRYITSDTLQYFHLKVLVLVLKYISL